jgi:DNA-binding GntR family transcriptional regulator
VALGFARSVQGVGTFVEGPTGGGAALNHAWLHASSRELVAMRTAIDERAATMAAGAMASLRRVDRPAAATLSLIHLLAREVAVSRFGDVEEFVAADRRFHQTVVASLRGLESTAAIRDRIDRRLARWWLVAALELATDTDFHDAHVELAAAILDGRMRASAAIARRLARRESDAISHAVGAAIR